MDNSTAFVCKENRSILQEELKAVYMAADEDEALTTLVKIRDRWNDQYSRCFRSWLDKWNKVAVHFAYPIEIRKTLCFADIKNDLSNLDQESVDHTYALQSIETPEQTLFEIAGNMRREKVPNWEAVAAWLRSNG